MKIIILAAGKGERLMPLTRNTPKPLLDVGNGHTLLEEQINRIQKSGVISEIILVIGYLAEQIETKIKTYDANDLRIKTVYNPFYEMSNNLISLWLGKHEMDDDFLITNGDNLFSYDIFQEIVKENKDGIFLSVSLKDNYDEDDMKVTLEDNIISRVSKLIPDKECNGESPGLVLVRGKKYRNIFKEYLEKLARNKEYINKFWLEVFNFMHENGINVYPWRFKENMEWQEVDLHLDLNKAKELLKMKMDLVLK